MPLLNCGSYKTVQVMSALQIELFFDEEADNWHYRVPALHINGGGTRPRLKETPETMTLTPKPSAST
jgi:hypothetical protein